MKGIKPNQGHFHDKALCLYCKKRQGAFMLSMSSFTNHLQLCPDCLRKLSVIALKAKRNHPTGKGTPSVESADAIAVKLSDHLPARDQSFFVAGFQECIKYLNKEK